jgi:hypothetical protein
MEPGNDGRVSGTRLASLWHEVGIGVGELTGAFLTADVFAASPRSTPGS